MTLPTTPDLLRTVAAWASVQLPGERVECVVVRFVGLSRPLCVPMSPQIAAAALAGGLLPDDPFVPTELQNAILDALAGKALRTDALAAKCDVDRSTLFRRGRAAGTARARPGVAPAATRVLPARRSAGRNPGGAGALTRPAPPHPPPDGPGPRAIARHARPGA